MDKYIVNIRDDMNSLFDEIEQMKVALRRIEEEEAQIAFLCRSSDPHQLLGNNNCIISVAKLLIETRKKILSITLSVCSNCIYDQSNLCDHGTGDEPNETLAVVAKETAAQVSETKSSKRFMDVQSRRGDKPRIAMPNIKLVPQNRPVIFELPYDTVPPSYEPKGVGLPNFYNSPSDIDGERIQKCGIPLVGEKCEVTFVKELNHFYITLYKHSTALKCLIREIQDAVHLCETNLFDSKNMAKTYIKRYCLVLHPRWNIWYRAEIVNWPVGHSAKICVRQIDDGEILYVHFTHLRTLPKKFYTTNRFATKCALKDIYPVGSTPTKILNDWPSDSKNLLIEPLEDANINKFTITSVGNIINGILGIDFKRIDLPNMTIAEKVISMQHGVRL